MHIRPYFPWRYWGFLSRSYCPFVSSMQTLLPEFIHTHFIGLLRVYFSRPTLVVRFFGDSRSWGSRFSSFLTGRYSVRVRVTPRQHVFDDLFSEHLSSLLGFVWIFSFSLAVLASSAEMNCLKHPETDVVTTAFCKRFR